MHRSAPVPGRSNVQTTASVRNSPSPTAIRTLLRPGTGALRFREEQDSARAKVFMAADFRPVLRSA